MIAGHRLFPHSLYSERLPLIHQTALKTYQSMLWPMANLFWYDFNSIVFFFFGPSALILLLCCHKQMLVCENLMYFFLIHFKPLSLPPARNSGCQQWKLCAWCPPFVDVVMFYVFLSPGLVMFWHIFLLLT